MKRMSGLNKAGISLIVAVMIMAGMLTTMGQINNGGGGGSGSGTVSANNGSAGAVANYAAAGGSTTVGPDATLTDTGTNLTYTGTQVVLPSKTAANCASAPTIAFSSFLTYGFCFDNTAGPSVVTNGTQVFNFVGSNLQARSVGVFGFANGASDAGLDTGWSRIAPNVSAMGNGTQGDESALVRAGDACRVTADITLPVNTATTICSWSLPLAAKAWAWQCQIPWVISAGTGTNTLAIIANPSQTPTGTTNGSAEIKTTNTNTATEATTAISASGATTLLTSGTITPNAATFMSSTSGTLLASGNSGTFAIQMTAAGTTATAAAKAGATCWLY
jgi:hypothetical protein